MPRDRTQSGIFRTCETEGKFLPTEKADSDKARSMLSIAHSHLASLEQLQKAPKDKIQWNSVYTLAYDALRQHAEAVLLFDKIKASTHECLFAYLCEKHPELELDWSFFVKARTRRNGLDYYGQPVTQADWREMEVQLHLYVRTLRKAIEAKLTKS